MDVGLGNLAAVLKKHFGHEQFRPLQEAVISDVLAGRDVLVVMPTGGGKSLCYQLPSLARDRVTVVVSPLIALMQNQVDALTANGIAATCLNSSVDAQELYERESDALEGRYRLIYLAPERLMNASGRRLMERLEVSLFAIDEAHCISEWGHDFRPEYRMLGQLRTNFGGRFAETPILALTATATPRVADDILAQLHLREPRVHRAGFERANLYYEVRAKQNTTAQIVRYLEKNATYEGIIYCQSRAGTENLAARLQAKGIAALPYHAGLEHAVRSANQHAFIYGDARVIVATIAFGMGIDKPDVRFVMHADLPRHLEGYYQETGRAGRDGLPADCILFFSHGDRYKIERFIAEKESEKERAHALWQLQQMINFAYTTQCRCVPLLAYFGEKHPGACGHCDNCRQPPVMEDVTEDARKLLSAVARTQQRFGLAHVINVLRGSQNERVERYRHDQLSVFGIGEDKPVGHWRRVAETLLGQGQMGLTGGDYPMVHLTVDSKAVLRGEVAISMTKPRAIAGGRKKTKRKAAGLVWDESQVDEALFDRLRQLRRRIADEEGVPPYVVFGDAALQHMAVLKPTTSERFLEVSGVGQFKLEKYGPAFLALIGEYVEQEGHEGT